MEKRGFPSESSGQTDWSPILLSETSSILLFDELDEPKIESIIAQLTIWESRNTKILQEAIETIEEGEEKESDEEIVFDWPTPINFYLYTPGGYVRGALLISYYMSMMQNTVIKTYAMQKCFSAGTLLVASGDERYALPETRFYFHPMAGDISGEPHDIRLGYEEFEILLNTWTNRLAQLTGKSPDFLRPYVEDEKYFFGPEEAKEKFGLIDEICNPPKPKNIITMTKELIELEKYQRQIEENSNNKINIAP